MPIFHRNTADDVSRIKTNMHFLDAVYDTSRIKTNTYFLDARYFSEEGKPVGLPCTVTTCYDDLVATLEMDTANIVEYHL